MQLFVDESGRFNLKDSGDFNVVAGLALPELPPFVMEIVTRQIVKLEKSAPSCWKKKGEIKGALIPTDDLRGFLKPILDIQGPVLVAAAFIDSSYQTSSQVDAYKTNRLTALECEKLSETDQERRHALSTQERLSVADVASGVREVEYGLPLFQALAHGGGVGANDGSPAPRRTPPARPAGGAVRGERG